MSRARRPLVPRRTSARAFLALALVLWATSGRASSLFDPIYRFRVLATRHFIVYFHQGEDRLAGRLHAGDFQAIVKEDARAERLEPLDRVNGGLTDWPGGLAPYAYGLGFHAYLANRYGADKFAALAEATARRVPYTASRVFKRIYGRSLGELWHEYENSLGAANRPASEDGDVRRLTQHGFIVAGPRFTWPACPG